MHASTQTYRVGAMQWSNITGLLSNCSWSNAAYLWAEALVTQIQSEKFQSPMDSQGC